MIVSLPAAFCRLAAIVEQLSQLFVFDPLGRQKTTGRSLVPRATLQRKSVLEVAPGRCDLPFETISLKFFSRRV